MANKVWVFAGLLLVECHLGMFSLSSGRATPSPPGTSGRRLPERHKKAESIVPLQSLTPPEGNTTFIGGTTWCVARPGAAQAAVQVALDWACGGAAADCSPVHPGGVCFEPDNLLSHASYVFNIYYQQNGNSDVACNFGGTAVMTTHDPSYGSCKFLASGPASGTTPPPSFPIGASALGILLYAMIH